MSVPTAAGPMTYLELCQRTARDAGVADAASSLLPSQVTGQQGELLRITGYVADAWRELQGRRHWNWMWEQVSLTVPAGAGSVATSIAADRWEKLNTYVPTVTSEGGRYLDYLPWQQFQRMYPRILAGSSIGVWTIAPDNSFRINGIAPAGGLTVTAERYANPTALRTNTDVPGMPDDLHMLIVFKAIRKFAGFDEAGTQRSVNLDEERDMYRDLLTRCLPGMTMGGSILDD